MTERITKADLDRQIRDLNSTRWVHRGLSADAPDYSLDWAYGGVRVVDDNGGRDVTVRGTKREIYNILRGMMYVARDQQNPRPPRTPSHWRQNPDGTFTLYQEDGTSFVTEMGDSYINGRFVAGVRTSKSRKAE
jgi:hypothetical protein